MVRKEVMTRWHRHSRGSSRHGAQSPTWPSNQERRWRLPAAWGLLGAEGRLPVVPKGFLRIAADCRLLRLRRDLRARLRRSRLAISTAKNMYRAFNRARGVGAGRDASHIIVHPTATVAGRRLSLSLPQQPISHLKVLTLRRRHEPSKNAIEWGYGWPPARMGATSVVAAAQNTHEAVANAREEYKLNQARKVEPRRVKLGERCAAHCWRQLARP